MPRHHLKSALQIIRHQLHIIQIFCCFFHIRLQRKINIPADSRRHKHPLFICIQRLSQFRQQQRIILLIGFVRSNPRQRCSRILPVNINTVESILLHDLQRTRCKLLSAFLRSGCLGKPVSTPSADRKHNLQLRMNFMNRCNPLFRVLRIPNNLSVPDQSERNVDHVERQHILLTHVIQICCINITNNSLHNLFCPSSIH